MKKWMTAAAVAGALACAGAAHATDYQLGFFSSADGITSRSIDVTSDSGSDDFYFSLADGGVDQIESKFQLLGAPTGSAFVFTLLNIAEGPITGPSSYTPVDASPFYTAETSAVASTYHLRVTYDAALGAEAYAITEAITGYTPPPPPPPPAPGAPEPAAWALMVVGVGIAGGALRRPNRPNRALSER